MKLLVTGGAGFIGSCFVRHILNKYPDYKIINLDILTYAGNLENLKDIENNPNYTFVHGDICDKNLVTSIMGGVDCCINFAAESHVDRSITGPEIFIQTNVLGTQTLLEAAKEFRIGRYIQISTDEVYGSLGQTGYFTENTPLAPNSPYSASKTGGDLIARAYFETFKMPVLITRCSNNYGPYQYPEKLIPLFISNLLQDKQVPVYGDGMNVRDWLYVYDHCSAIDAVLHKGKEGEVYNIGGNNEKPNIEITKLLLKELNKTESLINYVEDRLGHDRRYAIDSSKIQNELGWSPSVTFEEGIKLTIQWYLNNQEWIENLQNKKETAVL
ncbi:MAG: dTDP-glucose 4,6-dehydratase [Candidatus Melainabacteria bacterium GWF2_32_7]|nr:MAG: dTDP-glucose 4,6-dehydratase [Candidatus Melainabacteria bacterium GWF2_32_7]